ncbi:MAG: hypothetical protein AAFU77_03735 [Myxococcota bacterium]
MKVLSWIAIVLLPINVHAAGQIPVEVSVGHERLQHEILAFAPLDESGRFSLFTQGRFSRAFDQDNSVDSVLLATQAIYNLTDFLGVALGASADRFTGVSPLAGLSLEYADLGSGLVVNLFPSYVVALDDEGEDILDVYLLVFYQPSTEGRIWRLFAQLQSGFGFSAESGDYGYSYGYARIGPNYRDELQFGFAADIDHVAATPFSESVTETNFGVFIRTVL